MTARAGGDVRRKWRPRLAVVIFVVCAMLVTLPLLAIGAVRLTSNQFVRETERALLTQAAVLAEVYAQGYRAAAPKGGHGNALAPDRKAWYANRWHPVEPRLRTHRDAILPPRPPGQPTARPVAAPYAKLAGRLSALAEQSQRSTLAGYLFLDPFGRAISASSQAGYSYGHISEVQQALEGHVVSVLRSRYDLDTRHVLASISRDTSYRVYVAHPVVVEDRVVGVVYLSRTPLDLRKFLYQERGTLYRLLGLLAVGAAIMGFVLWRMISGPIGKLAKQSREVARGQRDVPGALPHYGVRELADLGQSVVSMGRAMRERADALETYTAHVTHELKSPVTSIVGASELLLDSPDASADRRSKLVRAIHAEGLRMNALLGRLRELARARVHEVASEVSLSELALEVGSQVDGLQIGVEGPDAVLPLSLEQGQIVLSHMAQNAVEHGAGRLSLSYDAEAAKLTVADDGEGVSDGNMAKIMDPFFTTRRDSGGTGMGLAIVAAVLEQTGGAIAPKASDAGAVFEITFGAAL